MSAAESYALEVGGWSARSLLGTWCYLVVHRDRPWLSSDSSPSASYGCRAGPRAAVYYNVAGELLTQLSIVNFGFFDDLNTCKQGINVTFRCYATSHYYGIILLWYYIIIDFYITALYRSFSW